MEKRPCPDPEVVAAWIDHGLAPADRDIVEAHMAGCDDCRVLVAQVLETQGAIGQPQAAAASMAAPMPVPATAGQPSPAMAVAAETPRAATGGLGRGAVVWVPGSLLAAAAVWLLVTRMPVGWWQGASSHRADSKLADLVDAVRDERTVEARLTGGFRYGPLRALVRSGGSTSAPDNYSLYGAAGKIRRDAEENPTPANLHALGVAQLLLGEHDAAVAALEDAVGESPQNAQFQSDLAAAYLARAQQLNRPDDLPRAIGAAERSISAERGLVEPRFNRALALEAMFLGDQARRAWEDYLTHDSSSEWAEEARRHLAALQRSAADVGRIRNNSPPELTTTTAEAGLDWLLRQGLSAWADAVLSGDAARASRELSRLTAYASSISSQSRDPFARSLIPATTELSPATIAHARVASGVAQALASLDADDVVRTEERLRADCPAAVGSLALFCDVELAAFDVLHRDEPAVRARVSRALGGARSQGFAYIEGRALRADGYRLMFNGDYARALDAYRTGAAVFGASGYAAHGGLMAVQIAELYDVMGLPVDGWQWRYQALEAAGKLQSRSLRFLSSLTLARIVNQGGDYHASRVLLTPVRQYAVSAVQQLPSMFMQIRAALANGDVSAADELLSASEHLIASTSDFRASRFTAELATLRALASWHSGDRPGAEAQIDGALDQILHDRPAQRATALLQRARIRLLSSANGAQDDVREALNLLDRRGMSPQQVLQLPDAGAALDAIAALVLRDASLAETGLTLAERVRELLDGRPASSASAALDEVAKARARIGEGNAALFYLFADDALLTWVVSSHGVRLYSRPLEAQAVKQLAATLSIRLTRAPARDDLWKPLLTELSDLLFGHLPDEVRRANQLVIVPDAALSRVPLGALIDRRSGRFLFEHAAVRVAPNLAFAFADAPVNARPAVLSVGAPELDDGKAHGFLPLRGAQEEATAVAELYPRSWVLLGKAATKATVLSQLSSADVIHFSGHAVAPTATREGRLLLAGSVADPAASLSFRELTRTLNGPRVVLAACDTGRDAGWDRDASSTHLAAGFLRVGARSVVANLWKIDDLVARDFYIAVHESIAAGSPMADAVARAQRRCLRNPSCSSAPATWLGATVYGTD